MLSDDLSAFLADLDTVREGLRVASQKLDRHGEAAGRRSRDPSEQPAYDAWKRCEAARVVLIKAIDALRDKECAVRPSREQP